MKRINEKVKDIVEVRKFQSLQDFNEDASATLSAYRFTDATSELMSKWLDRVVALQNGEGVALALAGYRGVGKSHFLATLSAIASQPELRTKVTDSHVAASAQALLRRRYPCVFVRRGTCPSLMDELRSAVAATFSIEESSLPDRVFDVLHIIRARAGDVPFLLLVDTAMERSARVTRDDGVVLAEIAEGVKSIGGLIGVALDDDIAGADGSNAAIVRSFSIDYLDQEHLYKVVDSFVFPKNQQLRPVLHDVYEYFREVMPTFRWSEQRFSSLYPLHPAILDVAPFVRLYVNDFALLTFAAEAGERILGRPANSLIALDEVFDKAENDLRKVEELREAFEAYDRLNSDVVAKIPVMQRLQAKLILKALLVLSLEGQGTTAGEISSGTLIFDESDPRKANQTVEEIVRMFAAAMPEAVRVDAEEGREVRYGLKIGSNEGLKQDLEAAAAKVTDVQAAETIHRLFHERFSDSLLFSAEGTPKFASDCSLYWRGGTRRGRIIWQDIHPESALEVSRPGDEHHDWEVLIGNSADADKRNAINELPKAVWKPSDLNPDEIDAVKRFYVLQHDGAIREAHSDHIRSAFHAHVLLMDRLVSRVFLEDGHLVIDGFDYNFSDEARTSQTLSGLFSSMLEPLFEMRYPSHPFFLRNLGLAEVSSLLSDLYSGSRQKLGEVQQLAQTFALPLGLVKLVDGVYYPASREQLLSLDSVKTIEKVLDGSNGTAELNLVYAELRKPPTGLVREAQQLILAAMVSQRMVEFVTSKGDRINQRSLDLRMIWDDIVGLARPQESAHSTAKLAKWAVCFAGRDDIKDVGLEGDLAKFKEGAAMWLADWDSSRILGRFNDVPEESLNTAIWKTVTSASKTLGASASLIRKFLEGQTTVDECLGRVSELFLDDISRFEKATNDLEVIRIYLDDFAERERFRRYAVVASASDQPSIEAAREAVLSLIDEFEVSPSVDTARRIGYAFSRFQREYSEFYLSLHDSSMRSHETQEQLDQIKSSDDWWLFESLAALADESVTSEVGDLLLMIKRLDCSAKTEQLLTAFPQCSCGFIPARQEYYTSLPDSLKRVVQRSITNLLATIGEDLEEIEMATGVQSSDRAFGTAAKEVLDFVKEGKAPAKWTGEHARAFRLALSKRASTRKKPAERKIPTDVLDDVEAAVLSLA
jgi:hypothetical protein